MLTTLFIFLSIGINVYADDVNNLIASSTSTSTPIDSNNLSSQLRSQPIDVEEELRKIGTTCLTTRDYEMLAGNVVKYYLVGLFIYPLIEQSVTTIGLRELRTALRLPPPAPWKRMNRTEPSDHELASATTIEEYMEFKEPRTRMRSLDSGWFFERNIDTAIVYLNKRIPSIQTIFKKNFEEACPSPSCFAWKFHNNLIAAPDAMDRKEADRMMEVFSSTRTKIDKEKNKMLSSYKCWREDEW